MSSRSRSVSRDRSRRVKSRSRNERGKRSDSSSDKSSSSSSSQDRDKRRRRSRSPIKDKRRDRSRSPRYSQNRHSRDRNRFNRYSRSNSRDRSRNDYKRRNRGHDSRRNVRDESTDKRSERWPNDKYSENAQQSNPFTRRRAGSPRKNDRINDFRGDSRMRRQNNFDKKPKRQFEDDIMDTRRTKRETIGREGAPGVWAKSPTPREMYVLPSNLADVPRILSPTHRLLVQLLLNYRENLVILVYRKRIVE